ncbi:MAG: glycosyltransferase [bacterium]
MRDLICLMAAGGTTGDVRPLLGLAVGLKQRGHRIRFFADPGFKDLAEQRGITGEEWFSSSIIPQPVFWRTESAQRYLWGKLPRIRDLMFIRKLHKSHFQKAEAFLKHLDARNNSAIVASIASLSARSVLYKFGPKCAKIISCPMPYQPSSTFSLAPSEPFFKTPIGKWFFHILCYRRLIGFRRKKYENFIKKTYHLVSVSSEFFPRPKDWLPNMQVTGYIPLQETGDWQPPDSLVQFLESGDEPLYVGFGSLALFSGLRGKKLAAKVIEAVSRLNQRCIIQSPDLSDLSHPSNIYIMDYAAPHHWLFPRCAVIVHHGGYGTTHACLSAGKPMVIYPFHTDEFLWAKKVAEFGIGPTHTVRIWKLDQEELIKGVLFALKPSVQRAAQRFSVIRNEDGLSVQISAIESIIEHHQRGLSPWQWNMPSDLTVDDTAGQYQKSKDREQEGRKVECHLMR